LVLNQASETFKTEMANCHYIVEPKGADSPNQNKHTERYNDTFGVTVRVLLYGSGLPALFWSVALLHAVFLHNRRVNKSIMMTPFEAWYGRKPDLRKLRVFGSQVCVKRTGKHCSKLDQHDFTGILLGYTATDENIRYIDVNSRQVKSSHHAIFDEAWYLQPKRPPFAQMLYDIGLEPDPQPITPIVGYEPDPPFPPLKSPPPCPQFAKLIPLPLRVSSPPSVFEAWTSKSTFDDDLVLPPTSLPPKQLEHKMIMTHDISCKDFDLIYLSPSPYANAFEEELDLRRYNPTVSSTAGIECSESSGKVFLRAMTPSTPAAKIRAWHSRLQGAWIIKVGEYPVHSILDIEKALLALKDSGATKCTLLLAHSSIQDGLIETGTPQVNIDMLNSRHSMAEVKVMTQEQFN
jgi:hypothetical protein